MTHQVQAGRNGAGIPPEEKEKPISEKVPQKSGDSPVEDEEQKNEKVEAATETKPTQVTPSTILQKRPFIIKGLKYNGESENGGDVTGSILSQSLDKMAKPPGRTDATLLTLAGIRKLVPGMSRFAAIQKFCTPSGTLIDDESILFVEYLELEGFEEPTGSGVPSLQVFFRGTDMSESSGETGSSEATAAAEATSATGDSSDSSEGAKDLETLKKSDRELVELIKDYKVEENENHDTAGMLDEDKWAVVLRNCAVFYGWIIDPRTKRIVRAPKPAFRLRSKVDQQAVSKIPDFAEKPKAVKSTASGEEAGGEDANDDSSGAVEAVVPKSDRGIPNFRVNDDSRIEITAHEDELTVSMARSDFSEKSTEASVSASYWGISASVSAAHSTSKSNTSKSMTNSMTQTLVGRYMFPRCDLILWPDEMEPTPELAELIDEIRRTKSIKALRKLQAEYGHLFCQNLTLGGRLLSTKILSTSESQQLEQHKQSFKTSIGASVSGGFAGFKASASVKNTNAGGSESINETNSRSQDEVNVFEAVGGDTILATNPVGWSATVGDHTLWRVINRDGLTSLVEILSGMPGYGAVQSWFVQAVPALGRYMVLDESHMCKARLRVTSPTNALSIFNAGNNVSYYLGHDADGKAGDQVSGCVTPRLNIVNSSTQNYWARIDAAVDISIFHPATYRAPAIFGYNNFEVGSNKFGSQYDKEFVKTEWDIIAPFDEELKNGTRVILRSCRYSEDPSPGQEATTLNKSHMVVFRNAEGEFVPAMSDSDEYQYWRILKTDASEGRHIKPGDGIRLCWDFNDQTTGWRDFTEDTFGRRQSEAPKNASGPLFLKVPWPRFERQGNPTALIMSPDASTEPFKTGVTIDRDNKRMSIEYCLQDLQLRIDNVTNDGRGDSEEYMLHGVRQKEGAQYYINIRKMGTPMQMRQSMFWFGL